MPTDADDALAEEATKLLASWGHPDLAVTGSQVRKWRRDADALPVASDRRPGRRPTVYGSGSAEVAAAIGLALETNRNLDDAILAAFGNGAPVAEKGLRAAANHYLRSREQTARHAYSKLARNRSAIPRSLRLPIPGSRRDGAELASDAVLALLLGEEPRAAGDAEGLVLEELAPEVGPLMAKDDRRRIEFVMRRLTFAALRRTARHIDIERWREACHWVAVILDYSDALVELQRLFGESAPRLPNPLPLVLHLTTVESRTRSKHHGPEGLRSAVLGLLAAMVISTRRRIRQARETAHQCAIEIPRLRALAMLAKDIPDRWRPGFPSDTGPVFIAQLPKYEREQLISTVRHWLNEHPTEAEVLTPVNSDVAP